MTWKTHAAWYGYPTPREMRYWTAEIDVDDAHPVAEGIRP